MAGRILILRDGFYPPDQRLDHEVRSLHRAGFEVHLLAQARHEGELREEVMPFVTVHRFTLRPLSRWHSWRLIRAGVHAGLSQELGDLARRLRPRVIQVVDLPRLSDALSVGKALRLPVIYDRWENYPAAMAVIDRASRAHSRFEKLYYQASRWRRLERQCLPRVAGVLCVVEESVDDLARRFLLPRDRLALVGNYPDAELFSATEATAAPKLWPRQRVSVVYTGVFGPHRGLAGLLRAASLVKPRYPELFVALVGMGDAGCDLKALAAASGLGDSAHIGPVAHDALPGVMAQADICAVPQSKNAHTDTTVPWKLFQGMMMGKPVLSGNADPLRRIVEGCDCGKVGDADHPASLAAALEGLMDGERRAVLGENGRRAYLERYQWREAERELLRLYDLVLADPARDRR